MQELVFFMVSDFEEAHVAGLRRLVEGMAHNAEWVVGPPVYVDEVDTEEELKGDDEPIRTVGGVLTLPAPSDDRQQEQAAYAAVVALIEQLEKWTKEEEQEIELELDGVFVGDIESGQRCKTLELGLIKPWREKL